jgi:diaminopimelate epimerase
MGNPHCVLQVDDVASAPVATLGPRIETHAHFPAKTNVGFMRIAGRDSIDLRVFERGVGETAACGTGACGVGETAACGTGACAAVVSGQQLGLLDTERGKLARWFGASLAYRLRRVYF